MTLEEAIRQLESALDEEWSTWEHIPPPFASLEIDSYFDLEDKEKKEKISSPRFCASCKKEYYPIIWIAGGYEFIGWHVQVHGRQARYLDIYFTDNSGDRPSFYDWPVCSEVCQDVLTRKINSLTKRRNEEWQRIQKARRILQEAKQYLKPNQRLSPSVVKV